MMGPEATTRLETTFVKTQLRSVQSGLFLPEGGSEDGHALAE